MSSDEITIYVRDRRKQRQFIVDNLIMDEWYPIIGPLGYALYSLYVRMANESRDESSNPGYTLICNHFNLSTSTLSYYNRLLEWCGLIYRDRPGVEVIINGKRQPRRYGNKSTTYYILDVPNVTRERLDSICCDIEADDGLHDTYRQQFLAAIEGWRPIEHWWGGRSKKRKIKAVVAEQSSLPFGDDSGSDETAAEPIGETVTLLRSIEITRQRVLDEIGHHDPALVQALIWQAQADETTQSLSGRVISELREGDEPSPGYLEMALAWRNFDKEGKENLLDAASNGRLGHFENYIIHTLNLSAAAAVAATEIHRIGGFDDN